MCVCVCVRERERERERERDVLSIRLDDDYEEIEWSTEAFFFALSYLPTPPVGQDMTQGQFLSGV